MKNRLMYGRIPVYYAPMQHLLIDIKTMPQAIGGYHLLLVIICDQTNFTIAVLLRDRQTQTIAKALIYRVIYLFSPPRQIVCDEATKFTSAIVQAALIMPLLKDLKSQINKTIEQLSSQFRLMSSAHNRYSLLYRQMHGMQMIHHFALLSFKNYLTIQVGTLQRFHRQYIRYESVLDDTLIGIENLNSGYLTHRILDPQVLTKYLEIIEDDLEDTAPEYEPVFTSVDQYYGNSLASITNTMDDLLLQLPILIKLKVQVPMSLFGIETVPVPLDAEKYIGDQREHTQIIPKTEYIAPTDNNYVPLTQAQISLCAKIGYTYYCKYAHL